MTRFFVKPEEMLDDHLMLTGENAAHAKVLRLKVGETVLVCDGEGIVWVPHFGVRDGAGAKKDGNNYLIYYIGAADARAEDVNA